MTEREYRQADGISRSELWKIRESPEKFKWAQEHPEKPTPALVFGAAVHKLLLEADSFSDEFAVAPEVNKRTNEGKAQIEAFLGENADKTIIDKADYEKALEMVRFARESPFVAKLLDGEHEKPFFWLDDVTDELCKVRLDCLTEVNGELVIVDYKTTANASTEAFMMSALNYGYDFQSAMYSEAVKKATGNTPRFVFVAQEKFEPYSVNILTADDAFVSRGYDIFRELIGRYHDCRLTGNWYGYLGRENAFNDLSLPAWLLKQQEE